ncbi:MAG: family 16 glycoside hydrolase [Thermoguttaceae bacterium]
MQILDSWRNPVEPKETLGALYGISPPLVNAARKLNEWQVYDIVYVAPRRDAKGKVAEPGSITALNGVLVQQNAHFTESVLHGQTMGLHLQGCARGAGRHLPRVGPPKNLPAPSRRCFGWGVMHTNDPRRNTLTVKKMGWQRFRESPCRPTSARWPCGRRREIVRSPRGNSERFF